MNQTNNTFNFPGIRKVAKSASIYRSKKIADLHGMHPNKHRSDTSKNILLEDGPIMNDKIKNINSYLENKRFTTLNPNPINWNFLMNSISDDFASIIRELVQAKSSDKSHSSIGNDFSFKLIGYKLENECIKLFPKNFSWEIGRIADFTCYYNLEDFITLSNHYIEDFLKFHDQKEKDSGNSDKSWTEAMFLKNFEEFKSENGILNPFVVPGLTKIQFNNRSFQNDFLINPTFEKEIIQDLKSTLYAYVCRSFNPLLSFMERLPNWRDNLKNKPLDFKGDKSINEAGDTLLTFVGFPDLLSTQLRMGQLNIMLSRSTRFGDSSLNKKLYEPSFATLKGLFSKETETNRIDRSFDFNSENFQFIHRDPINNLSEITQEALDKQQGKKSVYKNDSFKDFYPIDTLVSFTISLDNAESKRSNFFTTLEDFISHPNIGICLEEFTNLSILSQLESSELTRNQLPSWEEIIEKPENEPQVIYLMDLIKDIEKKSPPHYKTEKTIPILFNLKIPEHKKRSKAFDHPIWQRDLPLDSVRLNIEERNSFSHPRTNQKYQMILERIIENLNNEDLCWKDFCIKMANLNLNGWNINFNMVFNTSNAIGRDLITYKACPNKSLMLAPVDCIRYPHTYFESPEEFSLRLFEFWSCLSINEEGAFLDRSDWPTQVFFPYVSWNNLWYIISQRTSEKTQINYSKYFFNLPIAVALNLIKRSIQSNSSQELAKDFFNAWQGLINRSIEKNPWMKDRWNYYPIKRSLSLKDRKSLDNLLDKAGILEKKDNFIEEAKSNIWLSNGKIHDGDNFPFWGIVKPYQKEDLASNIWNRNFQKMDNPKNIDNPFDYFPNIILPQKPINSFVPKKPTADVPVPTSIYSPKPETIEKATSDCSDSSSSDSDSDWSSSDSEPDIEDESDNEGESNNEDESDIEDESDNEGESNNKDESNDKKSSSDLSSSDSDSSSSDSDSDWSSSDSEPDIEDESNDKDESDTNNEKTNLPVEDIKDYNSKQNGGSIDSDLESKDESDNKERFDNEVETNNNTRNNLMDQDSNNLNSNEDFGTRIWSNDGYNVKLVFSSIYIGGSLSLCFLIFNLNRKANTFYILTQRNKINIKSKLKDEKNQIFNRISSNNKRWNEIFLSVNKNRKIILWGFLLFFSLFETPNFNAILVFLIPLLISLNALWYWNRFINENYLSFPLRLN